MNKLIKCFLCALPPKQHERRALPQEDSLLVSETLEYAHVYYKDKLKEQKLKALFWNTVNLIQPQHASV